jgi:hypothetical protein
MPTWVQALKEWNSGKDKWCIPRKGSREHAEVLALMGPKKDTRPYAKAPGVASAIGKLREEEAATRARNEGRKAAAKKKSTDRALDWLGELLFELQEEGFSTRKAADYVVQKAEKVGIPDDELLGALAATDEAYWPDISKLKRAIRAAVKR